MSSQNHQYHLVDPSPLPIVTSFSLLIMVIGGVMFMHDVVVGNIILPIGLVLTLSSMYSWWRDVIREAKVDKAHTPVVQRGLSIGMLLFIASEVMFFVAFFWAFFHARFFTYEMSAGDPWSVAASVWPPKGIVPLDPWNIPLMNTLILLLSGTTVSWAAYSLDQNNRVEALRALKITIILAIIFTCLQAYEYHHASFAFTQGIYPSNFFMATGFHGFHVIIGTIFLIVAYYRTKNGDFDAGNNRLGFKFAAWYWEFVDIVWVFLFFCVYVFGD